MTSPHRASLLIAAASAFGMVACDQGRPADPIPPASQAEVWDPVIDPSEFVRTIDNPYFPLAVGRVFLYELETPDGLETGKVVVSNDTKRILGVRTTVVYDTVRLNGQLIEATADWYAQHQDGTVWYFGEDAKAFENGTVSTAGSWEAGVNGAKPGIIMLAAPTVGATYFQEFAVGVAEDEARVLSLTESVSVRYGNFQGCLKTRDWTRLESGSREHKFYCPDVGLVLELSGPSGKERNELVDRRD